MADAQPSDWLAVWKWENVYYQNLYFNLKFNSQYTNTVISEVKLETKVFFSCKWHTTEYAKFLCNRICIFFSKCTQHTYVYAFSQQIGILLMLKNCH